MLREKINRNYTSMSYIIIMIIIIIIIMIIMEDNKRSLQS